ncbi:MAG: EAL domain-containing protein [Sulfurospirillaceae bacterium]|nr:EAL domain-containing protein [Sulfurospirillaceae bacterium]MDD2825745.1 EAL domain-containing protein [Sulfurospirillaceae bacterium]
MKESLSLNVKFSNYIFIAIFFIMFTLFSFFAFYLQKIQFNEQKAEVLNAATYFSYDLKTRLERALSASYAIAALISQGDGVIRNFESVTEDILPFYPGVIELAIAPLGIIQQVAPLKGNEKALGLNLFETANQKKEALLARDSGKLTLAGPLVLAQEGMGLIGRLPIFLNKDNKESFWGFVLVVIDIAQLFEPAKLQHLNNKELAFELWRIHPDTKEKQIIIQSEHKPLAHPIEYAFDVPNAVWTLSLAPNTVWEKDQAIFLLRMMSAFFAAMLLAYLAKVVFELKKAKLLLESQVIQTTGEKLLVKKQLEVLLDAIPDLIWLKDTEGKYLFCNRAFERLFGAQESEIIGKYDYDFVDFKLADFFRANDLIALSARHAVTNEEELHFKEDGYQGFFETIKVPVYDSVDNVIGILGIARDISVRKANEEKIEKLEYFDALTGLANRAMLNLRMIHDISIASRKKEQFAILMLDFDHFKNINDTLGHAIGDILLVEVSKRLKHLVREEDMLSRQGGDEFIVLLPGLSADGAAHVAKKLLQAIEQPLLIKEHELTITASIGIALYPDDGMNMEELIKRADAAMYLAKQNGRNNYRFFTAEIQQHSSRVLMLENALRYAYTRGELSIHYQPQISLHDGKLIGVEALIRWNHPEMGAISPNEFIPIAEESGQILLLGEWVMRHAMQRMKQWIDMGFPPMKLAINLSAVQFHHEHLAQLIDTILEEVGFPVEYLELELTESVATQNPKRAIEIMNTLHEKGIRLSIDDFGTGYSSFSYLKRFKVYKLKIDKSFIEDVTTDMDDRAIVKTIITLAKSLGLVSIAEGVETKEQLDFLLASGCDEVQGYYFSKPLNVEDFERYVENYLTYEQQ